MIKTEQQLRVMEEKLRHAEKSVKDTTGVEKDVLRDFAEELSLEIAEYKRILKGDERIFNVSGVSGIANALIKARIARGLSQADLAEKLGKPAQSVQRDEAGGYERATLARLADVADALGYHLAGVLEPAAPRRPLELGELGLPATDDEAK
ncbi:helix-turn-helix transcriptional regulator [Streptomyces sp. Lzd4kr]|nr:helix-turn-helix transcriptional regulator [Streptomyces sp. Lzd4kr]